jgi:hypothetical protein
MSSALVEMRGRRRRAVLYFKQDRARQLHGRIFL